MRSSPPFGSAPRGGAWVAIPPAESASSAATRARIERFRRREVTRAPPLQLRRQDEQEATVLVIRREDVRLGGFRAVALGMDGHRLVEHTDPPLEGGADVVVAVLELEPEHLLDRPTDHVEVAEPRELAGPAAGADEPRLLVANEERRIGCGVVVVEQLEQETEAALPARAGAALEPGCALAAEHPVSTVRTDEVWHGSLG